MTIRSCTATIVLDSEKAGANSQQNTALRVFSWEVRERTKDFAGIAEKNENRLRSL